MSTFEVGLTFTIIPSTYIPSMFLVQCLPNRLDKRVVLVISAMLLGFSTLLNGPSQLLGLPNELYLIIVGQALSGIFIAFLSIPALPEMIKAEDKATDRHRVNTLCSGLFNSSMGLGQTIGPILGGILDASVGFRSTQDIMGMICIVFASLYLFFGTGCRGFTNSFSRKALPDKKGLSEPLAAGNDMK